MSLLVNHVGSNIYLVELNILGRGNAHEHAGSTGNIGLKKRGGNSLHSRNLRLVSTLCSTNAHVSVAGVLHNRGNVSKVEVDKTGNVDKLGYRLNSATENVVGYLECVYESDVGVLYLLESLVGDYDKRVNVLGELLDTCLCLRVSSASLEGEGLGNDTDGKYAHFSGCLCYNGSRTGTGTAAHTCGDKHHVCTLESRLNGFDGFLGTALTDLGVCACALSASDLISDNQLFCCAGCVQSHAVGVDRDELNASDISRNHTVNSVVSAAAYTDDLNAYSAVVYLFKCEFHFGYLRSFFRDMDKRENPLKIYIILL